MRAQFGYGMSPFQARLSIYLSPLMIYNQQKIDP